MAEQVSQGREFKESQLERAGLPTGEGQSSFHGLDEREEDRDRNQLQENQLQDWLGEAWDNMTDNVRARLEPLLEQTQGWNGAVAVPSESGEYALIEPETGQIALPDNYRHPTLNAGTSPGLAKAIAAQQLKLDERQRGQMTPVQREAQRRRAAEAAVAASQATSMGIAPTAAAPVQMPVAPAMSAPVQADAAQATTMQAVQPQSAAKPKMSQLFSAEYATDEAGSAAPAQAAAQAAASAARAAAPAARDAVNQAAAGAVSPTRMSQLFSSEFEESDFGEAESAPQSGAAPSSAPPAANAAAPSAPGRTAAANAQEAAAAKIVDDEISKRKAIEDQAKAEMNAAVRAAKDHNKQLRAKEFAEWKKNNPGRDESEFVPSEAGYDSEAFYRSLGSMRDEFSNDKNGINAIGTKYRDESKKWKLIDKVMYSLQLGFFHISSEELVYDMGKPHITWSRDVREKMKNVAEVFGYNPDSLKGRRTTFRLVLLYASLSVDRNGKMFNEDANEWTMSDHDFCRICDLLVDNAYRTGGNPLAMSRPASKLGGTIMFPCGVMPKVVADVLCNPNNLTFKGETLKQADLVEMVSNEWSTNTYPMMKKMLANSKAKKKKKRDKATGTSYKIGPFKVKQYESEDLVDRFQAQMIVVENFLEAAARLDGLDIAAVSERYGIDSSLHYCLEEYKNSNKTYAKAFNGNYDADLVMEREKIKEDAWEKRLAKNRYYVSENPDGTIELGEVKVQSSLASAARLYTKMVKASALALNVPIMIGNVTEKGVGNVQTNLTLRAMLHGSDYSMSAEAKLILKSSEFVQAMSAVKLLMDVAGPGACRAFAKTGRAYTVEAAAAFARENYLPESSSEKMAEFEDKLSRAIDVIMTGDIGFKKFDNINWFLGLVVASNARAKYQSRIEGKDDHGIALSPAQLEDMLLHQEPGKFLADMMGEDAGIDAYLLMRGNNVGNLNLVSYNVQQALNRHAVGESLITIFVDNFPKYGINFLMSLLPMSKTITYLYAKKLSVKNKETNQDLVIGGNITEGPTGKFWEDDALMMNLIYDGIMIGRQAIVMPFIMAAAMVFLGYEPPDDKRNLFNPSMWKVGGEELHMSFWTNDITLWSLPIAHFLACSIMGYNDQNLGQGDKNLPFELLMNSLYEQLDGNVLLDTIGIIKNWQTDLIEMKHMIDDPAYESDKITISSAQMLLNEYLLTALNKVTPGATLYRNASKSSLIRGKYANEIAWNKVYDRSDQWHIDNESTTYIDDPYELMLRQNSSKNWLLGMWLNTVRGTWWNDQLTGYLWMEMPTRTRMDPLDSIYLDMFKIDYSRRLVDDEGNYIESYKSYEDRMARYFLQFISQFDHPQEAVDAGVVLPSDIRHVASTYIGEEIKRLKDDFEARKAAGEFATSDETQQAKDKVYEQINRYSYILTDWIGNDDIPEWAESYDLNITDWEVTAYNVEDNTPASLWDLLIGKEGVAAAYIEKGNIPNNLLPFTLVEDWGGYNKETENYWKTDDTDWELIESLLVDENGNDRVLKYGVDKGKTIREVIYGGEQPEGVTPQLTNLYDSTAGHRSLKPKEKKLSEETRQAVSDALAKKKSDGDSSNAPYKKSSYGGSKYGKSSSLDHPKIYNTRAYSPKIYMTRADSSPRVSNTHIGNSRATNARANDIRIVSDRMSSARTSIGSHNINPDRASTMGTRNPQSGRNSTYLNPRFETKGSREAYKRQDI